MKKKSVHQQLMDDSYHIKQLGCIANCKRLCAIEKELMELARKKKRDPANKGRYEFQIATLRKERSTLRKWVKGYIYLDAKGLNTEGDELKRW